MKMAETNPARLANREERPMSLRDLLALAGGNLRRHKLRVLFTTTGVVIAIATFVALLSFAAGSQKWVNEGFAELGLLTSMNVYPRDPATNGADSLQVRPLDGAAVSALAEIPGVRFAFPFLDFTITASLADTTVTTRARALPQEAFETALFSRVLNRHAFTATDAREAIVTHEFQELVGIAEPESLVGQRLVVAMQVASLDSALLHTVGARGKALLARLQKLNTDSLQVPAYRQRLMRRELNEGVKRFVSGLFDRQLTVRDTLVIRGVGAHLPQYNIRLAPIVIPEITARKLSSAGFSLAGDPTTLLASLRGGSLFAPAAAESGRVFPQVTLELERFANHAAVKDSVEALGYQGFSYAEQFEEIQRFHLYFYTGLGVVGFLALVTAALGILNTLVMSVNERRKEIGVIKSLGADESWLRSLFLIESALIGAAGSLVGVVLGWLGTKVVSFVIKAIMAREEMPAYEPFALPAWLVLLALAFGVGVSVLAGTYPAARAARVDPVEALRSE
jgi:putative ABC transport system permease protein